jgi:hypothetical protein
MSNLKRISAVALCAAVAASFSGCGNNIAGADTTYGAVIDGVKIPAGVFISMQMQAYYDALYYTEPEEETDESTDSEETEETETEAVTEATDDTEEEEETTTTPFTDKVIEGKEVREWINDETTKLMQEYAAIENKFDELGLSFEDNEKEKITVYMDSLWEYYGSSYEDMGISEDSQILIMLNSQKESLIFDYFYGSGGTEEISEADIRNYLTENNARINYIEMELKDGEGNLLKSDGKAEIKEMAEDYIERIKNGEDMNAVGNEYEKYYDALVEAAEAAAAEESEDEDTDASDESTDADTTEETEEEETITDNTTVISPSGSYPSEAVVEKVFDGSVKEGDVFLVEEDEVYYIVQYMDLFSDESYYEDNESTARHALKDDDFDAMVDEWTASQNVERNEAAYKRYKIEKFM